MEKQADWPCTVRTLFRERNLGCKEAVSQAITWFFEHEAEGIILEDDCLPGSSFFGFCDALLQKYRHEDRVRIITGSNMQNGRQWGDASYYFSRYGNIWGWATWRRVWDRYDAGLSQYTEADAARHLRRIFDDPFLVAAWEKIFANQKAGNIDTWDYQLQFITFFENGLCATPNVNLVSNLGFRADGTHTFDPANHGSGVPVGELTIRTHPAGFTPETEADYYFMAREYDLAQQWRRHRKWKNRMKRWMKSLFQ
ncbi:hypothetical protein [Chitinophaga lutea]|uniref:hypothetical protein n=1 Tax=Chitinophaga lutea TaxID=2488634 RepID=UPI001C703070|nr:hypothetical protein [Chitinophaga lutea]